MSDVPRGPGAWSKHPTFEAACAQLPPGAAVGGWIYEDERQRYFELAQKLGAGQLFVEIGTYGGATPVIVGLAAAPGARIVVIDSFENDTHEQNQRKSGVPEADIQTLEALCRSNFVAAGLTDVIEVIRNSSHAVGPNWSRPIDWLIVDGDHSFEGCTKDLVDFARWVRVGGLLVIDDVSDWDTVGQASEAWMAHQPPGRWTTEWRWKPPQGSTWALRRTGP